MAYALWKPYDGWLESKIADVNHVSDGPFAGSITAALFLRRFVEKTRSHVHFDIYGWAPKAKPGRPVAARRRAFARSITFSSADTVPDTCRHDFGR